MSEETVVTSEEVPEVTISAEAAEKFRIFLEQNKEYLKNSAGIFHTDDHSNW